MPSIPNDLRALSRSTLDPLQQTAATGSKNQVASVPRPRSRWMTRVLVPLGIVLATGAVLVYAARDALRPAIEVYVTPVVPKVVGVPTKVGVTETSTNGVGAVLVQAPGWIEPDPYAISVPALAEGVVKEVLVLEGESVAAGQVVVKMIDDDVGLQLRTAHAVIREREADMERAAASVATAEAQVRVEQSAATELRDEVTRKRDLVSSGGVSAGEFRRIEIRLTGLEARAVTAERAVDEARAALNQAASALATAEVGRDEVQLKLDRMQVRAPIGGVVLSRLVEPGSRISMGSRFGEGGTSGAMSGAVLRIYDPAKLQVRVDVPLADAAKVGVGTRAVVSTEALADRIFNGVVTRVIHEANIQRNTVQFKISLADPSPVLKPEMLTRVKLHAPGGASSAADTINLTDGATLLIAAGAVQGAPDAERFVWLVDTSSRTGIARRRVVSVAPSEDPAFHVVSSGLRLSDRVVIDPPPALRDGSRLKVLGEQTGTLSAPATPAP